MYLAIDIGGTKTLVAALDDQGIIEEQLRFTTPENYQTFLLNLTENVDKLSSKNFIAVGVAAPGRFSHSGVIVEAFSNLKWGNNVRVKDDIEKITNIPTVVNNDAKLACLSESMLVKGIYDRVLYVTISTGIGVGFTISQKIEKGLEYTEAGCMPIEHDGKYLEWQQFASGKAIVNRFGKKASEIEDEKIWTIISKDIAIGLADLAAVVQPDVIIIGGSVGSHFNKYGELLRSELKKFETPMVPIPPIIQAKRPNEAVIYGCYDYAKEKYNPQ